MKKILSVILSVAVMLGMVSGISVSAKKDIAVEFDGKAIEFDVKPEIIDGRTLVPLRKIFEEIGALVKWDGETNTVSARKNSKTITLTVDSAELNIDKGKTDDEGNPIIETVTLEVPAKIMNGRTLVPARAISESFGLNVEWDEENQKVVITSDDEEDDAWKENTGSVNLTDLTYEASGIEIKDNQIKITQGGDYTLTGVLKNGNITISTKERVKLRLSGVEITSEKDPCIFVEKADKAYITITDGTQNSLVAENSKDGAVYSKENLEIKGDGSLNIVSKAGHGIKASDNLTIEKGVITIDATSDGIHINDTFKLQGGEININSVGDGIDAESIVNISAGKIKIKTNGKPIETAPAEQEQNQEATQRRPMWDEKADVEFESSTKGINAEWMMIVSGGEFEINSASHAIHCADDIEISGGKFLLTSEYDKGISAHGNLTISGSETSIEVTKSTEAIESKKLMTINDGYIKAVSSDDAINATGGSTGMMPPGGGFGANGANRAPGAENGANPRVPANGQNGQNGQPQSGQNTRPNREWNNGQQNAARPDNAGNAEGVNMPNGGFAWPEGQMPEFTMSEGGMPGMVQRPQMPEGGMQGGFMGRNMKECLIINGGYIEVCGSDDCIDANGNMVINGGTIKAANPTGAFTGNFGVLDADGQIIISENANIILASSSGSDKSLKLSQNMIVVYCENNHEANEKITVSDLSGNVIYEYAPMGGFKAVLITSSDIKTGEKYKITIGTEVFETQITGQSTVIGTQPSGNGMGFPRGQRM